MATRPTEPLPRFPNYLQLRARSWVPQPLWHGLRVVSVAAMVVMACVLVRDPEAGLVVFWRMVVPVLPAVFFIAPGLWRNLCPLAALNQTPRVLGFARGWTLPAWLLEYGYVIGCALFFILASSRKWLFNHDGPATAWVILGAAGCAFVGGIFFKGKSGWCNTFCPVYPVQRIYNQTPFVTLPNSHCTPCVGCTRNCYDFNPGVAYMADIYDEDSDYSGYRRFFVAAFPGFVLAYFILPDPPAISVGALYLGFAAYMLGSVGLFVLLDTFVKVTTLKLTTLYIALAINLFYWFVIPGWLAAVGVADPTLACVGLRALLLGLTVAWILRTWAKERPFLQQIMQPQQTRVAAGAARALQDAGVTAKTEVTFLPQELRVLVEPNRTLLETAEGNHLPLEAGCRMGVCGADPVLIVSGMENLSPISDGERATLDRLGLGGNARMACMCRVKGAVAVSLQTKDARAAPPAVATADCDTSIQHVVIIGNGIAGVTAADAIRRRHPLCEIHLLGREKHPLYNRMAITRLIYGRSAMGGLHLNPDSWYEERRITVWLNTSAAKICADERRVELATGEQLPYDRLIIASGSESFVPPITNYGIPGTFVLREAEDAMAVRAYAQEHRTRHAVVAGGGLLGLEAGYALHKLGLDVVILERGPWLLQRQLDERGSQFLRQYLEGLGMHILTQVELDGVSGERRLESVVLKDGRAMPCELLLVAVGIKPNVALARDLGLEIDRGIVVDECMRTSQPDVYAVGDVAQFNGRVHGLWPVAVEQAGVAAINAVGGHAVYQEIVPVTTLKVVGVELTSIGRFEAAGEHESVIALEDTAGHRYRKLVLFQGRVVGAILLDYPAHTAAVTAAIKQGVDLSGHLDALGAGEWQVLDGQLG